MGGRAGGLPGLEQDESMPMREDHPPLPAGWGKGKR
jgi:hypothetical protein